MIRDEYLTSGEASRLAGVSQITIRVWADEGKLPSMKDRFGHRWFKREDVLQVAAAWARDRKERLGVAPVQLTA